MMSYFEEKNFLYDGSQLKNLFAYMNYGILGNSIVSWVGACDVKPEHMVDAEDLRANEKIEGGKMLHFIIEVFDRDLFSAVCLQRLLASLVQNYIFEKTKSYLRREGDDLYFNDAKLSISIATRTLNSQMIHFALNVNNEGTPVKTCALSDFKLNEKQLAIDLMSAFVKEYESILDATRKCRALGLIKPNQ